MPSRWRPPSATAWLSPVIMATRTPSSWSSRTASADSGRTSSSTAMMPRTRVPSTTERTVLPAAAHSSATCRRLPSAPDGRLEQSGSADRDRPAIDPGADAPAGQSLEFGRRVRRATAARAPPARRPARGDARSRTPPQRRAAAPHRRHARRPSGRLRPRACPRVSVPVLSKMTRSRSRARSSASRSLTSRPFLAPREVEMAITRGSRARARAGRR